MRSQIVIRFPIRHRDAGALALRPVLGVPLFLRSCLTLADAGLQEFIILAPAHLRRPILKAWQHYAGHRGLRLELFSVEANGTIASTDGQRFQACVHARYAILDATTVITARWGSETLIPALRYGRPLRGVGQLIQGDTESCTLPPAALGTAPLATQRDGHYFQVSDTPDLARLEHFLSEVIRHGSNGLIAKYVNKRISLPISRILARWRVSPNAITVFNMFVGLAAGIGTAGRTYVGLLCGAILFQCASILDGCDGEVAKLTHRTSRFGQLIDTISDNFSLLSFFIGLTIHHYRVSDSLWVLAWGLMLLGGIGLILRMMFQFLARYTNSRSLVTFHKEFLDPAMQQLPAGWQRVITFGKGIMKKEWYSLLLLGMAILGLLPATLYLVIGLVWSGILGIWILQRPFEWSPHVAQHTLAAPTMARKNVHGIPSA